nr:protein LAZY 1-like [Tanacetum cinerariifolium]
NSCTCLMGPPSLDDYEYYPKSNYYAKPPNKGRENQHHRSFACLEAVTKNDEYTQEQPSAELSKLFHGFLAIGTLRTDQVSSGAATPTISTSNEAARLDAA